MMMVEGLRCGRLSFVVVEVLVEHHGIFDVHHCLIGVIQLRH